MRLVWLLAVLTGVFLPAPAFAIDPGTAQGSMTADGITVPLTHAVALLYGNEEGLLDGPELRLLLSDREVPLAVLSGPILDRLDDLARRGEVRGLVLRLDPQRLMAAQVNGTVLLAPADPERSLTFLTLDGGGSIEALEVSETRVAGTLAFTLTGDTPADSVAAQVRFSAPRFRDVIVARVSGSQAADSPPVQVLIRWNEALRAGDFDALKGLSSNEKYAELETFRADVGDEALRKVVASEVPTGDEVRRQIKEMVIRGDRAFIIIDDDETRNVATASRIGDRWVVD